MNASDDETREAKELRDAMRAVAIKMLTFCKIHLPKEAATTDVTIIVSKGEAYAYASSGARESQIAILRKTLTKLELEHEAASYYKTPTREGSDV